MDLKERIESFSELGEILRDSLEGDGNKYSSGLDELINNQHINNEWFTFQNVRNALKAIADELTVENLTKWTDAYPELNERRKPLKVGVIMAGNIPLVGFHDFLSVLISGNSILAKTSSKDAELIVRISEILCSIDPSYGERIQFTEAALKDFDAVIATGSDNSSRYFEYYFGRYPHIIRKNRNSVAIIEGDETDDEIKNLGTDVFSFFGLGCRNVSKMYIPRGFDISSLEENWHCFSEIVRHTKYANNYDFNKAVYLVNKEKFFDSGYLLLKEDDRLSSPVSVLHYEYYDTQTAVKQELEHLKEKIQCVVGKHYTPFGKAQSPQLWDYADGIDTIEFLQKKI
jgi:hypothetical protein